MNELRLIPGKEREREKVGDRGESESESIYPAGKTKF